jgi:hypothetical protein
MAETIGSLIDKICIVELKIYHTQEQVDRTDVEADHVAMCRDRLATLGRQRDDLVLELTDTAAAWAAGRWTPKVYRQFKMYNDPRFRVPARGQS